MRNRILRRMELGEQLRAIRKSHGLTQGQAAEMAETTQSNWSRWESGQHDPSGSAVVKFLAATGSTVADLQGGSIPEKRNCVQGHQPDQRSGTPFCGTCGALMADVAQDPEQVQKALKVGTRPMNTVVTKSAGADIWEDVARNSDDPAAREYAWRRLRGEV